MQMQTTLDCIQPSIDVDVEVRNSTMTDEEAIYLYDTYSPESLLSQQIEKHLDEEENEKFELQRRYEEFLEQEESHKPKQQYIRVGKKC